MSTDYTYDEQGQFFPYFILTISALVAVPLTYSLLKPTKELENTATRIKSDFKPPDENLIQGQKKKQWRRERRFKRIMTVVVGYATIALMLYLIAVTKTMMPKIWDPYDILEIPRSADEKRINKRYRDLSRVYHPDKARPDESKNQTIDDINEYWVELSKAYKALTDKEIRNNYIQYVHPDGKQSFSIGIALPNFIVTEGSQSGFRPWEGGEIGWRSKNFGHGATGLLPSDQKTLEGSDGVRRKTLAHMVASDVLGDLKTGIAQTGRYVLHNLGDSQYGIVHDPMLTPSHKTKLIIDRDTLAKTARVSPAMWCPKKDDGSGRLVDLMKMVVVISEAVRPSAQFFHKYSPKAMSDKNDRPRGS
ncbi:MAG: hypothetical protein Q9213_006508 [Squamulea squamosa]